MKPVFLCFVLLLLSTLAAFAADKPPIILNWPEENPQLKIAVVRFHLENSYQGTKQYLIDMTAQNVSGKPIPSASPQFQLFDKNNIRIGQGSMQITNVGVGETIKFQLSALLSGTPETVKLLAPGTRRVSLTVYSVPAGALLKVDGTVHGLTPQMVTLPVGSHMLEFSKEGYTNGSFPLVVTPDQLTGSSVSFELGSAMHDSIELRDGTVLNGDVETLDGTQAAVRIGGVVQAVPRNKIKKILLIEREIPGQ
jgi:PEGA domain